MLKLAQKSSVPFVNAARIAVLSTGIDIIKRLGPVPQHLYIVMDGNRRWAKQFEQAPIVGHRAGYSALVEILDYASALGVKEITVYAFAIANFKRSEAEKRDLMDLAKEKFADMYFKDEETLQRKNAKVRVVGSLASLRNDVQELARKLNERSATLDRRLTLNICMAYSSQDELTRAVSRCTRLPEYPPDCTNPPSIRDTDAAIDAPLLNSFLDIPSPHDGSNPPLLIRTSGERRLSNFLSWQCGNAMLQFTNVLWPDFRIHHLLQCILSYQRRVAARTT